eukprot:NODE_5_length_3565_cov_439.914194_g4_i0.p1 GENE.NODE_5_length_3565_cov_439.914194_g4_i0~~NODE_5_length_3565_cov_439.914194_g4_i0.p1  ORF type:complete len:944 (-),score=268.80 NODE_5_length_3565_cov_439.914194_g4_i0:604-3435(-)
MDPNKGSIFKVVGVVAVVFVASCLVFASQQQRAKNVSEETRILQTTLEPLLLPARDTCTCPVGGCTAMTGIPGICSFQNGATGCCSSTVQPTDLPRIEPSTECTPKCLSAYYTMWCDVGCTDHTAAIPTLCQASVDSLYQECNNCPTFGSYDTVDAYIAALAGKANVAATGCVDFTTPALIVEEAAPKVSTGAANNPVTPGTTTITTTTAQTATIQVIQTGVGLPTAEYAPPTFMDVGFKTPNGEVTNIVTKRSEDFTDMGAGTETNTRIYQTTHAITLGPKAEAGEWNSYVSKVLNMYGTQSDVEVTPFTITVDPPITTSWGNVLLCPGATADHTGSHVLALSATQTVDSASCCSTSGCMLKCAGSSNTNRVTALTSNPVTNGWTLRDCTIGVGTVAGSTWTAIQTMSMIGSVVTFDSANARFDFGQTSTVTTPDGSRLVFVNGATMNLLAAGTIVNMGAHNSFDATSSLQMQAENQQFFLQSGATMVVLGIINLRATGQRFIIDPEGSALRNNVLVDAENTAGRGIIEATSRTTSWIEIRSGRLEATRGATIGSLVKIIPNTPTRSKALVQATSKPADYTAEICCASICADNLEIEPLGALFIIPPEGSDVESCVIAGTTTEAARITGSLTMKEKTRIVMVGAKEGGTRLIVAGTVTIAAGTIFEVELAPSNTNANAHEIVLMSWTGGASCNTPIEVIINNGDSTRPITQFCRTSGTTHFLVVSIPAARPAVAAGVTTPSFTSSDMYAITFNKDLEDCPETCFTDVIREVTNVDPKSLSIISYVEQNDITATFRCLSTQSVEHADGICRDLVNDARTSGNTLHERLDVVNTNVDRIDDDEDDDSNTALFGLFGLLGIIPLCLLAICLLLRLKKRKADNQYMQDTATFGNVAASPQPINYPYPYHGAAQATVDAKTPPPIVAAEPMLEPPILTMEPPPAYVA